MSVKSFLSFGLKSIYSDFLKEIESYLSYDKENKLVVHNYDWRCDILYNVGEMHEQITYLMQSLKYKEHKIIFIGHSLGGLMCRIYLETHDNDQVLAAFFCGTPFFGDDKILHLLMTIGRALLEENIEMPVESIPKILCEKIYKKYRKIHELKNTFFTPCQLIQLVWKFRENFILFFHYRNTGRYSMTELSKILHINIAQLEYTIFNYNWRLQKINNKNIYYYIVYNAQFENSIQRGDGIIKYSPVEIEQFNATRRVIQIRENDMTASHTFLLNSNFIQRVIIQQLDILLL